jgi:hypothetical protein
MIPVINSSEQQLQNIPILFFLCYCYCFSKNNNKTLSPNSSVHFQRYFKTVIYIALTKSSPCCNANNNNNNNQFLPSIYRPTTNRNKSSNFKNSTIINNNTTTNNNKTTTTTPTTTTTSSYQASTSPFVAKCFAAIFCFSFSFVRRRNDLLKGK